MQRRPKTDGFGYAYTPYRIEHRPTYGPLTKEEMLKKLDQLAAAGVKAWWTSVAAKGSYPMFASKYLPYRDDAIDYFPWLAEQAHARGIALFSWEYLTTAPMLGEQKPEWRWKFFDWQGPRVERDKHYVCWNSPYGELLKKYCVEVVGELGFDGIWFDGAFLYGHGASGQFACCCDFCADKYMEQTGRALPRTIDFRDEPVRQYMEWRYMDHTEYWRSLSAYVRERVEGAIIVYNYFNRLGSNIDSGSPLRRMADDAAQWPDERSHGAMEGMISAEVGFLPYQTTLLAKILRAVNDNYPVELWGYGMDIAHLGWSSANPDPSAMLLHAYLCASVNAFASFGMGREDLSDYQHVFPALTKHLDPIASYICGESPKEVALVVSGCTKDYGYVDDENPLGDSRATWNAAIGMHNLLGALRLQSEVLLDNMLTDDFLGEFGTVVLPDVRCMRRDSADALYRFVENGGTLLAVGETATHDELGRLYEKPLLDDMFQITWHDDKLVSADMVFSDELVGVMDEAEGIVHDGLPKSYRLGGLMRLCRASGGDVLARASYNQQQGRVLTPQGIQRPAGAEIQGDAIVRRAMGKGVAIYIAPNIAECYGRLGPSRYSRVLIEKLIRHQARAVSAEAPPNVTVTLYQQDNRTVVHVMNVPVSILLTGMDQHNPGLRHEAPQDCVPVGPICISICGKWNKAYSPTQTEIQHEMGDEAVTIEIPRIEHYAMIVLEK